MIQSTTLSSLSSLRAPHSTPSTAMSTNGHTHNDDDATPVTKLRVMGVPEHFNYPFQLAQQRHLYTKHHLDVDFIYEPLGTGAMLQQLKAGDVDVIVALTEGIVFDIAKSIDSHADTATHPQLLGTYVQSSLQWAISTGATSQYATVESLRDAVWGISRYGSGSHLMVCVLATQRGWDVQSLRFHVCGNFKALRDSVNDGTAGAFMWEQFMSKPYYDSGECRRVGEVYTPWPCFMYASTRGTVSTKRDALRKLVETLREACDIFRTEADMHVHVAKHHEHDVSDTKQWYDNVNIVSTTDVTETSVQSAINALIEAKQLPNKNAYKVSDFVDTGIVNLTSDIKKMKLYSKPELLNVLYSNLRYAGLASGPLSYKQLLSYDQHSYYGTSKLDLCVERCSLTCDSKVIQIGSSVGGPARYLAGRYNIHVLAIELQYNLYQAAVELTERCETAVQEHIDFVAGNVLNVAPHLQHHSYNAMVSWLTVLHLTQPQRLQLFSHASKLLVNGGTFYCEDFVELNPVTPAELTQLRDDVYCNYISTQQQYIDDLTAAGFEVETELLTDSWLEWSVQRAEQWRQQYDKNVHIHGDVVVKSLQQFYDSIVALFKGGNVGGIRVTARKQ